MRTSFNSSGRPSRGAPAAPVLIAAVLAASSAAFMGACHYPEARMPGPAMDDAALLRETTDLLAAAKISKTTWTPRDQDAFNERLTRLTFESRLRLAKQWTGLVTSKRIVLAPSTEKDDPPLKCTCVGPPCGHGGPGSAAETPAAP